jgi:hypothetical protein
MDNEQKNCLDDLAHWRTQWLISWLINVTRGYECKRPTKCLTLPLDNHVHKTQGRKEWSCRLFTGSGYFPVKIEGSWDYWFVYSYRRICCIFKCVRCNYSAHCVSYCILLLIFRTWYFAKNTRDAITTRAKGNKAIPTTLRPTCLAARVFPYAENVNIMQFVYTLLIFLCKCDLAVRIWTSVRNKPYRVRILPILTEVPCGFL